MSYQDDWLRINFTLCKMGEFLIKLRYDSESNREVIEAENGILRNLVDFYKI